MAGTLYHTGYRGFGSAEAALAALRAWMSGPRRLLRDIRYVSSGRPILQSGKKNQWTALDFPKLSAEFNRNKSHPVPAMWMQSLGNINYNRPDLPIEICSPGAAQLIADTLQQGYDVLLLCGCPFYAEGHKKTCHRSVVVKLVKEIMPEIEVRALAGKDEPEQIVQSSLL